MATLVELLRPLLETGSVVFREPPHFTALQHPAATVYLRRAFDGYRLQVAGPLLDFDPASALRAGEVVLSACWFLVHHKEPVEELARRLALPVPRSPAEQLSGDLLLRYLPQVYRRAKALAAADPLGEQLARLLRQWPLSGVLSDVPEAPLIEPSFAGHAGLELLYAERLAGNFKVEWLPAGRGLERFELVWRELGNGPLPVARVAPALQEDGHVAS
ncbi:MAG: hypothetical protein JNM56_01210 [Planctomycetia bacterium]|nr:hypothetical protein [Planctomycetia bacterium]